MHLTQALTIATNLVELLQPHCTIINIAGSIRRQKTEVKDIEIVCLPKVVQSLNLFEEVAASTRTNDFTHTVVAMAAAVIKGNTAGKYMQVRLHQGINLDLFMPDEADYYRQYAIRTGSAEYAAAVIAKGWRNIGWCGSDKGLRKITDCGVIAHEDGRPRSWKCLNPTAEPPPHWKSEQEFFAWIKTPWKEPKHREVGNLYNPAQ